MKSGILTGAVFVVLIAAFALTASGGRLPWQGPPAHGTDWCEAHQVELSKCEKCNPKIARGGTVVTRMREPREGECPNTLVKIELGPGAAVRAGVRTAVVETHPISETARGNAETAYVPSSWARVGPRLGGVVRSVTATLGQEVEAGAPLAVVDSAELSGAKAAYLQAASTRDLRQELYTKTKDLFDKRLVAGKDELEARTELEESRLSVQAAALRLRALGLSEEQVATVEKGKDVSAALVVTAPFAGTVVATSAVVGEMASPERPLFEVASLERMWVAIDLPESDLTRVAAGQRVVFLLESFPGKKFVGKVAALGGSVDDETRTVKAYAEAKNLDGLLRAHMFGRAEITVKAAEARLLVPREAVQNDGDCLLVFVESVPNVFQARKIETGAIFDGGLEVRGGLVAGEKVATTGSFLLKTEAMKGQMGAG
jgi:membrane fusion protein, heavy metal efflux system